MFICFRGILFNVYMDIIYIIVLDKEENNKFMTIHVYYENII
mgnify:CR=1 FL=1